MRYIFSPQARIAYYERDLVVLTLHDNKFHFIKNVPSEFLRDLYHPLRSSSFSKVYGALAAVGAIHEYEWPSGRISASFSPAEYVEQRWLMPLTPDVSSGFTDKTMACWALWYAGFCVRYGGFEGIVSIVSRQRPFTVPDAEPSFAIQKAIASLNRVFFLDFSGNQCLTYSLALLLMLRRRLPDVKLVVGVKTRPFFSHAWVEHGGRVINDDPELRNKLAIILEA